jgi:hypothetical protein
MLVFRLAAVLVLAAIAVLKFVQPALAHTRVEIGPYTLVLGWQNEPVIVGERNALLLEITEAGIPVEGLEGTLELTVLYGGESFTGQLAPAGTPGTYAAEIFPTVRGQYEVQLTGRIGDEPVDMLLEPEAVLPANVLQFPEAQPDPVELAAEVDRLTESQGRLRALAVIGMVAGGAGLLMGSVALFLTLRQRSASGVRTGRTENRENK